MLMPQIENHLTLLLNAMGEESSESASKRQRLCYCPLDAPLPIADAVNTRPIGLPIKSLVQLVVGHRQVESQSTPVQVISSWRAI